MAEDRFWTIIETSTPKFLFTYPKYLKRLKATLESLPPDEIMAFDERRRELLARSYTWKLWAAAYVIGGGCGDDSFDYFRSWLISSGRDLFTRTVANPDSLATNTDLRRWMHDIPEFEQFDYVAAEAYESVTGNTMRAPDTLARALEPSGAPWDEDDPGTISAQVPMLAAKCDF